MRKKLLLFLSLFFAASVSAQMSGTYTINGDASQTPDYQTINDAATRSTTAPCAGADEFAEAPVEPVEVLTADFEDVELNASGIWMPTEDEQDDMGYAYMRSQGWEFSNYTYYGYVFAFTASNSTDTTTTGYDASFTAVTAGGHNSEKYAVVYPGMAETMVRPTDGEPRTVSGCYITNNLWTYQAILEGDGYGDNTPFGGADGTDPDYLVIIATGYDADDEEVGTAEFYLADYRFENSADDYVVTDWKWFDLSVLGEVSYIEFTMDGTKTNAYGISTPTYFCMDDFNGEAPVEPVETLIAHFEDVELNADGIWMSEEYNVQSAVESQGWSFSALTSYSEWEGVGYESWSQFRVSNSTNTELTGLEGQYTAVPGKGHKSSNYAVAYVYGNTVVSAIDGYPREITGCYVTNNMYAYTSMTEGDSFAGDPFTTGDYLVLYAIGLDEMGDSISGAEFYLADYRSSDEAEQYIVTDWRWFDLSVLGEVSKVRFEMAGSRTGDWGLNTPAYFCMDDFNGEAPVEPVETLIAHFEDVELNADGIWQAETFDENTYLYSQGWKFSAFTSETYWSNFTVSNSTNTELTGYDGQYTATTGKGVNGSDNYAVAYVYNTEASAIDGYPREITGCYVTNNMYAYTSMTEGDYYAGDPFTTGDYLVLYAIGLDEAGEETGRTEFYLADYRSSDEAEQYIVTDWRWFDLSVLGEVSKVRFEMAGSRTGDWGLNTPAYFCMDDFNGEAPAEPVETLIAHFEDVELNADGIWMSEEYNVQSAVESQGWSFSALTSYSEWEGVGYESWSQFRVSNSTNTELTGLEGQYTAVPGHGYNNSDNYAVAYVYGNTEVSAIDGYPREITGCYVTNNMYAYTSMTEGDSFAGDPFTTGDYLVLYAIGLDEAGEETGRTEFYLADYRSSDEAEQYIVTDWRWFDLSVLGEVSKVRFEMAGSRTGDWGLNTPAYFCMDDFNGEAPDAVEETAAESVNISVYPNPSNGVVNIKVAENEEFTYYVYNSIGQTVMTGTSANAITTIDLSTFGSGMYLLNVNCKGNVNAKKVFIK